jgi:hypothetical protein
MRHAQMPSQRLAAKPAFEAHDMVGLHRSPDRDSRLQQARGRHRRDLAEAAKRAMHHRNQSRNLINGDIILRHITPDDLRNQGEINLRDVFIGHNLVPQSFD